MKIFVNDYCNVISDYLRINTGGSIRQLQRTYLKENLMVKKNNKCPLFDNTSKWWSILDLYRYLASNEVAANIYCVFAMYLCGHCMAHLHFNWNNGESQTVIIALLFGIFLNQSISMLKNNN